MQVIHKICTNLRNGENDVTFIVKIDTEKISGLNFIYFHAKTILSGDYFLAYFGL
jgi:hypothetical protein